MINCSLIGVESGDKIVVRTWESRSLSVASAVVSPAGEVSLQMSDGRIYLREHNGLFGCTGETSEKIAVQWTSPPQSMVAADIISYFRKLSALEFNLEQNADGLLAGIVESVGDTTLEVRTVHWLGKDDQKLENVSSVPSHVTVGDPIEFDLNDFPDGCSKGDFVLCATIELEDAIETGVRGKAVFSALAVERIGSVAGIDNLDFFLPKPMSARADTFGVARRSLNSFSLIGRSDIEHLLMIADARHEPDLAVFISTPDENGKPYLTLAGVSGAELRQLAGTHLPDLLTTNCPPQGVWAFVTPKFEAGSYDTDMGREWYETLSGSFTPATDDHFELIGLSRGALGELIIETMQDSGHRIEASAEEVVSAWLELAPSSHSETSTLSA